MSYHVTHWTGKMESDFPLDRLGDLLDELAVADSEHPDIAVTHESEWSLTVNRSGFAVLENLEDGEPLHMGPMTRSELMDLMRSVATGLLREVQSGNWLPGYPPRG